MKDKNRGHRETRKAQQELPEVPALGNLSMPRKNNRAAAKYIAAVGVLWDRRRADRKARKAALARQDAQAENPRLQHLDKAVREQMLFIMQGWSFDHPLKAFVPQDNDPERLEELLDAIASLDPTQDYTLRVAQLRMQDIHRVRGYLGQGSLLIPIQSIPDGPEDFPRKA